MKQPIIIEVPEGWEIDEAAIQKVALKKKFVPTYGCGSRFRLLYNGVEYILARFSDTEIALINLRDGNRWRAPIATSSLDLTDRDLSNVVGSNWQSSFALISRA